MTDRELMQQALYALESRDASRELHHHVITALKERLAQPQRTHWEGCEKVHPECRKQEQKQEPVAHVFQIEPDGRPRIAWDDARNIKVGDKLYKVKS